MTGLLIGALLIGHQTGNVECPATLLESINKSKLTYANMEKFMSFQLKISDSTRLHTVYLRKTSETYLSLTVNEVFGNFYDSPNKPSPETLMATFAKRYSIGGILYELPSKAQPNYRLRYRMVVSSTATPREVTESIQLVAGTADDLESKFSGVKEDKL